MGDSLYVSQLFDILPDLIITSYNFELSVTSQIWNSNLLFSFTTFSNHVSKRFDCVIINLTWIIIKLIMCSDENYFMRVEITTKRIFEAQYSMSMTLSYAHNFLKCSLVLVFHSNERSYSISRNSYLFKPFENWKYIGCIFCNWHKIRMYRNVLIVNYYNWVNYQHWTFFWNWIHTVDSMFLNWWFDMQTFRSMPCG